MTPDNMHMCSEMNFTQEKGNFLEDHLQAVGKSDGEKGMKNASLIPFTMSYQALGVFSDSFFVWFLAEVLFLC